MSVRSPESGDDSWHPGRQRQSRQTEEDGMDWLWHALLVCLVVIPVTIMWVAIVVELFRRRDLSGRAKVGWLVVVFVFPILGSLVYVAVTWWHADADTDLGAAPQPAGVPRQPATIADLSRLDQLRRAGVLTDAEFEAGKRRILEGPNAVSTAAEAPGRHATPDAEVGT
jgi:Phospholipase_D-nuclease N-terminal/Short C-terminal domain